MASSRLKNTIVPGGADGVLKEWQSRDPNILLASSDRCSIALMDSRLVRKGEVAYLAVWRGGIVARGGKTTGQVLTSLRRCGGAYGVNAIVRSLVDKKAILLLIPDSEDLRLHQDEDATIEEDAAWWSVVASAWAAVASTIDFDRFHAAMTAGLEESGNFSQALTPEVRSTLGPLGAGVDYTVAARSLGYVETKRVDSGLIYCFGGNVKAAAFSHTGWARPLYRASSESVAVLANSDGSWAAAPESHDACPDAPELVLGYESLSYAPHARALFAEGLRLETTSGVVVGELDTAFPICDSEEMASALRLDWKAGEIYRSLMQAIVLITGAPERLDEEGAAQFAADAYIVGLSENPHKKINGLSLGAFENRDKAAFDKDRFIEVLGSVFRGTYISPEERRAAQVVSAEFQKLKQQFAVAAAALEAEGRAFGWKEEALQPFTEMARRAEETLAGMSPSLLYAHKLDFPIAARATSHSQEGHNIEAPRERFRAGMTATAAGMLRFAASGSGQTYDYDDAIALLMKDVPGLSWRRREFRLSRDIASAAEREASRFLARNPILAAAYETYGRTFTDCVRAACMELFAPARNERYGTQPDELMSLTNLIVYVTLCEYADTFEPTAQSQHVFGVARQCLSTTGWGRGEPPVAEAIGSYLAREGVAWDQSFGEMGEADVISATIEAMRHLVRQADCPFEGTVPPLVARENLLPMFAIRSAGAGAVVTARTFPAEYVRTVEREIQDLCGHSVEVVMGSKFHLAANDVIRIEVPAEPLHCLHAAYMEDRSGDSRLLWVTSLEGGADAVWLSFDRELRELTMKAGTLTFDDNLDPVLTPSEPTPDSDLVAIRGSCPMWIEEVEFDASARTEGEAQEMEPTRM